MRIIKLIIVVLFLLLISKASSATVPDYAEPIKAYQERYNMQFFVWRPLGLQSKWYATYDGYPVAQIAEDQWVYGVIGNAGQLTESLIAVGSVNPNTVHVLTPLPPFLKENLLFENSKADYSLKDIFKTKCDNFGIIYTNASLTPIAWKSDTSKIYMWGGKKWVPIFQRRSEILLDTIRRDSYVVADMLRKNKIMWTQIDSYEFANYVRSAGYNWIDDFETNTPIEFSELFANSDNGRDYSGNYSGENGNGETNRGDDGGWDTGRE